MSGPRALSEVLSGGTSEQLSYPFFAQNANKIYSCSIFSYYSRFEVRSGDVWTPNDLGGGVERSEVTDSSRAQPYDTNVWLSYALRITGSLPADWMVVGQFHDTPQVGDLEGLSPPWALEIAHSGAMQVVGRSSTERPIVTAPTRVVLYQETSPGLDAWTNLVWRLKFSQSGGGEMQIWKNGSEVFNDIVAIGYNETAGPYFKFGCYRAATNGTAVVEYANVEVGTTSLLSRVANPLPHP